MFDATIVHIECMQPTGYCNLVGSGTINSWLGDKKCNVYNVVGSNVHTNSIHVCTLRYNATWCGTIFRLDHILEIHIHPQDDYIMCISYH